MDGFSHSCSSQDLAGRAAPPAGMGCPARGYRLPLSPGQPWWRAHVELQLVETSSLALRVLPRLQMVLRLLREGSARCSADPGRPLWGSSTWPSTHFRFGCVVRFALDFATFWFVLFVLSDLVAPAASLVTNARGFLEDGACGALGRGPRLAADHARPWSLALGPWVRVASALAAGASSQQPVLGLRPLPLQRRVDARGCRVLAALLGPACLYVPLVRCSYLSTLCFAGGAAVASAWCRRGVCTGCTFTVFELLC